MQSTNNSQEQHYNVSLTYIGSEHICVLAKNKEEAEQKALQAESNGEITVDNASLQLEEIEVTECEADELE